MKYLKKNKNSLSCKEKIKMKQNKQSRLAKCIQ